MYQALALAEQGRGRVEPNPMVGCVLVRDGRELGRGYHTAYGGPHAEVAALKDAADRGESVAGCSAYVTLEPCSHFGKTPPCTEALIEASIGRAVIAMVDPYHRVAGNGISKLREAGIEVELGVCESLARQLNEPFIKRVTTGLPWVTLKWASTLDGKVATQTGDSKWISGEASRQIVHELRARADAVLVGVGTVLADDPQLTARGVEVMRIARRVVVDAELRTPPQARLTLSGDNGQPPVTIAVDQHVVDGPSKRATDYRERGIELVPLPHRDDHHLDLEPLLRHLVAAHNATNVLVEGGAGLTGSLIKQGLADRIIAFVAPRLLGDESALSAVSGLTTETIDAGTSLELRDVKRIENDVMLDYRIRSQTPKA